MLEFYLIGAILVSYFSYRMYRHEGHFSRHVRIGMIIGAAFYSWISFILILIHFKLHYKWEFRGKYEELLKQRALLL